MSRGQIDAYVVADLDGKPILPGKGVLGPLFQPLLALRQPLIPVAVSQFERVWTYLWKERKVTYFPTAMICFYRLSISDKNYEYQEIQKKCSALGNVRLARSDELRAPSPNRANGISEPCSRPLSSLLI